MSNYNKQVTTTITTTKTTVIDTTPHTLTFILTHSHTHTCANPPVEVYSTTLSTASLPFLCSNVLQLPLRVESCQGMQQPCRTLERDVRCGYEKKGESVCACVRGCVWIEEGREIQETMKTVIERERERERRRREKDSRT